METAFWKAPLGAGKAYAFEETALILAELEARIRKLERNGGHGPDWGLGEGLRGRDEFL